MLILKYFYPETASLVRITSEQLCLDYTFAPAASRSAISLKTLCELAHSGIFDFVHAYIPPDADVYYLDRVEHKRINVCGWTDMSAFDAAEPDN